MVIVFWESFLSLDVDINLPKNHFDQFLTINCQFLLEKNNTPIFFGALL